MEIIPLGHSSFLIKTKTGKLVLDPVGKAAGFTSPKTEADAVAISHDHFDHNDLSQIGGAPLVISGPGEYEIKGFSLTGIPSWHDDQQGKLRGKNTIYLIEAEDIRLCHLGDQGAPLTDAQAELLEGVDVLFTPVGGVHSLDAQTAWQVTQALSPRLVIPMHYKTAQHSRDFAQLAGVDAFIQEAGLEPRREKKLPVNKLNLPEETELVILEK